MLEFDFTAEDMAHTRLALSPLWELVCSLRVLRMPSADAVYVPWAEEVRPRLHELDEMPLLLSLVPPGNYLPDFITPPPAIPLPDLGAELDSLASASAAQVRHDLHKAYPDGLPPVLEPIASNPRRGLPRLATALRAYWDVALAASWPRLRDVLQGDIIHRGREFAIGGASRLFADLHPTVSWSGESLTVDKECSLHLALGGEGMLLIPSAFAWPSILTITAPPFCPTLIYPARGVATLWGEPPARSAHGLARLIGAQRAELLGAINGAATTTELARRLRMTAGGVSQHLSVLRDAGLVTSNRAGRVVLYARTPLGESITEAAG